jgi:hypothetical protein
MHFAGVDQIEVDQLEQRLAQRCGVVITGGGFGAGRTEPRIDVVGFEKAGLAQRRRHERTREIAGLPVDVAVRRVMPDLACRDAVPENLQLLETMFRWIAGDDRRIDGADRNAAYPVGLHAFFVQGLIDPGLIGPERAATLQYKRHPVAPVGPPSSRNGRIRARCSRVHDLTFEFLMKITA